MRKIFHENADRLGTHKLPVIDALSECFGRMGVRFNDRAGENILIVGCQHMIVQTVYMARMFKALGLPAENIHLIGKIYSTSPLVEDLLRREGANVVSNKTPPLGHFLKQFQSDVRELWEPVVEKVKSGGVSGIIILDDGAQVLDTMPEIVSQTVPVIDVEQTTNGTHSENYGKNQSCIEVASGAIKKKFESPFIVRASIQQYMEYADNMTISDADCGIIGFGAIGRVFAQRLPVRGNRIKFYDPSPTLEIPSGLNAVRCENLAELVGSCDYLIGCTGRDVLKEMFSSPELRLKEGAALVNLDFSNPHFRSGASLISTSSKDMEWNVVLRELEREKTFEIDAQNTVHGMFRGSRIKILKRGFPVNFDGSPEDVPVFEIQPTIGMLIGGVIQGLYKLRADRADFCARKSIYMISPAIQSLSLYASRDAILPYVFGEGGGASAAYDEWGRPMFGAGDFADGLNSEWVRGNSGGVFAGGLCEQGVLAYYRMLQSPKAVQRQPSISAGR